MKNKIPFSLVPFSTLKKSSNIFLGIGKKIEKNFPFIKFGLEQSKIGITAEEYISMSLMSSLISFIVINLILNLILFSAGLKGAFLLATTISFPITFFIFLQQLLYPKIKLQYKTKDIERNLLPALEDLLVQLNSGIPLFRAINNIASKDYGELSKDFAKAVNKINAGISQIEVLDELASNSSSLYFRRAIWQLVNGMKTGANTSIILKEVIAALAEEQLIQIQKYAGQLNPLVLFYMITTIILPSLSTTFLIVISSFISANEFLTKSIFWILYALVVFFQIMFLGLIKTKRPSLLETK